MNRLRRYVSNDNIIILGFVEGQNSYIPLERSGDDGIIAYLSNE
jgi:hypothetical protein